VVWVGAGGAKEKVFLECPRQNQHVFLGSNRGNSESYCALIASEPLLASLWLAPA
jgi:hypothetical protein